MAGFRFGKHRVARKQSRHNRNAVKIRVGIHDKNTKFDNKNILKKEDPYEITGDNFPQRKRLRIYGNRSFIDPPDKGKNNHLHPRYQRHLDYQDKKRKRENARKHNRFNKYYASLEDLAGQEREEIKGDIEGDIEDEYSSKYKYYLNKLWDNFDHFDVYGSPLIANEKLCEYFMILMAITETRQRS